MSSVPDRKQSAGTGKPDGTASAIKQALNKALTAEEEASEWKAWLQHPNPAIRWEAFKLAMAYRHGKPVQPVSPTAPNEPVVLKVEHIGAGAEFFAQAAKVLGLK